MPGSSQAGGRGSLDLAFSPYIISMAPSHPAKATRATVE